MVVFGILDMTKVSLMTFGAIFNINSKSQDRGQDFVKAAAMAKLAASEAATFCSHQV